MEYTSILGQPRQEIDSVQASTAIQDGALVAKQEMGSVEDQLVSHVTTKRDSSGERQPPPSGDQLVDETQPTKRSHQTAFPDATNPKLDDSDLLAARQRTHDGDDARIKLLACPFHKKDRHKYPICLSYQLRRIKDVKQHINRKHHQPALYCSRCFKVFHTTDSRDSHTRLANCEVRAHAQFDGITEQQRKALAQYPSRGKSIEDQWYDMWDTIFPNERRPKSVYVGDYLEETLALFRSFWNNRRSEIVSSIVETSPLEGLDFRVINEIMTSVLTRFEEAMLGSAGEREGVVRKGRKLQCAATPAVGRKSAAQGRNNVGIAPHIATSDLDHTSTAAVGPHVIDCEDGLVSPQNDPCWPSSDFNPVYSLDFSEDFLESIVFLGNNSTSWELEATE